jgi:HSP20 family protein
MAKLTMWQPLNEMLALDAAMDQALNNRLRATGGSATRGFPIDLTETTEGYSLQAVLPGINPEHLTIDFADGVLTIKAEVQVPQASEGTRYHIRERVGGTFERAIRFPTHINADAIEASYEHGVLTLNLPKAESVKPRRIEVQATTN